MSSAAQQLRAEPASNLTALSHCLKSVLYDWLSIDQLQQLDHSLRAISTKFQTLLTDTYVDILLPQDSSTAVNIIFYGFHDNDHFYRLNLPSFRQDLLSIQGLWHLADFFEFPLQHLAVNSKINRHMSSLLLEMELEKATHDETCLHTFQVGAFTRPYPGLNANGDGYWYKFENNRLIVCVVDGLGHGEGAQIAQKIAIACVQKNYRESFEYIFMQTHLALRKTRGVAMTLARICFTNNTIESAGIGNVELRLYPQESFFVPKAGILGMGNKIKLKVAVSDWSDQSTLVIYSDGLTSKWRLAALNDHQFYSASFLSHLLVRNFERENDDSTALVVLGR